MSKHQHEFDVLKAASRPLSPAERAKLEIVMYAGMKRFETAFWIVDSCSMEHVAFDWDNGEPPMYAFTDGNSVHWWSGALANFSNKQLLGILIHETIHVRHGHLWRLHAHAMKDYLSAMIAADMEIERILRPLEEDGIIDMSGLDVVRCPEEYDNLSAEEIFVRIYRPQPEDENKDEGGHGDGQDGNQSSSSSPHGGQGSGSKSRTGQGNQPQHGNSVPEIGGFETFSAQSETAQKIQERLDRTALIMNGVEQMDQGKGRGLVPGAARERLNKLLSQPSVPWTDLLRDWMRTALENSKNDWTKPSKQSFVTGVIMPKRRFTDELTFIMAVDTSGSMSKHDLAKAASETLGIVQEFPKVTMIGMQCDAAVHIIRTLESEDDVRQFVSIAHGRGGTSFAPVFKTALEIVNGKLPGYEHLDVAGIVYFTDGICNYDDIPKEAREIPTVWCYTTNAFESYGKAPFGDAVLVKDV